MNGGVRRCYHFLDCISPSGCLAGSTPGWSRRLQAPIRRVFVKGAFKNCYLADPPRGKPSQLKTLVHRWPVDSGSWNACRLLQVDPYNLAFFPPWIRDKVCLELVEVDIERPVKAEGGRDRREDLSNQPEFKLRSTLKSRSTVWSLFTRI